MKNFKENKNFSVVTAILPRQSVSPVLDEILNFGAPHVITVDARGSLIKEKWYQFFLPTLSPEQEILHFLVPNSEADSLMEQIAMTGNLSSFGSGSIFVTECLHMLTADDFPLWELGKYRYKSDSFDIRFKKDLVALFHIADKDESSSILRAAIKAGSQGPTVSYIQGYGLRDRLGLLRITKQHEKELIAVIVDPYDAQAVFEAMAKAGRVDQPGRGLLYQVPISRGLINLASVFNSAKHSASIQQIVRAIDHMNGDTQWRANPLIVHDSNSNVFKNSSKSEIKDSFVINVLCHRKDTETVVHKAMNFGVSGASIQNWRFTESNCQITKGGRRVNREFGCILFITNKEKVDGLLRFIQISVQELDLKECCIFSYKASMAKTFLGKKKAQS